MIPGAVYVRPLDGSDAVRIVAVAKYADLLTQTIVVFEEPLAGYHALAMHKFNERYVKSLPAAWDAAVARAEDAVLVMSNRVLFKEQT